MENNNSFFLFHVVFNNIETTYYGKERKSKRVGQHVAYLKATKSSWDRIVLEIFEVKLPYYETKIIKVVEL